MQASSPSPTDLTLVSYAIQSLVSAKDQEERAAVLRTAQESTTNPYALVALVMLETAVERHTSLEEAATYLRTMGTTGRRVAAILAWTLQELA